MTDTALPTRRSLRQERADSASTPASPPGMDAPPPAPTTPRSSGVFEAVDGMRGLAIVSVLLYHSGWSERGLFGVDVFFVISGFLITLLMLKELDRTGRLRIGSFFARRARRLVPGLVVTIGVTLFLLWLLGTTDELTRGATTSLAAIAQVANWQQIAAGDAYWESSGGFGPLAQMWSLSVTEQFYIAWPFVVLAVWFVARRRVSRFVGIMLAVLVGAAAVAPILFDGTNTDRLYLGTDSRAVAFVAGAAAAGLVFWLRRRGVSFGSRVARVGISAVGVVSLAVVVIASVLTTSYHESWLYQGGLALVSVAAAVLTGTLCFRGNVLVPVFALRPFAAVGRLSYSLFLLHLPAYWFVQQATDGRIPPLALFGVGGGLTLLAAAVLHHMISEPLRKAPWRPVGSAITMTLAGGMLVVGAWYLPAQRDAAALSTAMPVTKSESTEGLQPGVAGGRPVVLTVGDSIAVDYADMLTTGGQFAVRDLGAGGCGLLASERTRSSTGWTATESAQQCGAWRDRLATALRDDQPDFVLVHTAWDATEQYVDGRWITRCDPRWKALYQQRIDELMSMVEASPTKPRILLADDRPSSPVVDDARRMSCFNDATRTIAEANPAITFLGWGSVLCPEGTCRTEDADGRALLQPDGVHLTAAGKAFFTPWLERRLTLAQGAGA